LSEPYRTAWSAGHLAKADPACAEGGAKKSIPALASSDSPRTGLMLSTLLVTMSSMVNYDWAAALLLGALSSGG
jgi:hypothetical protein